MSESISQIILPTRPQPDTIVAIFLLKKFGQEKYPGVENATVAVDPKATPADGMLLLDVGGGELDHHGSDKCATELVAEILKLTQDKALSKFIAYARRDDTEGKGTLSTDPLDRAFGLSGLIAGLNKQFPTDANKIVEIVLPLLEAHYHTANEHYNILPKNVADLKQAGMFISHTVQKPMRNMKLAFITSDNVSMVGYLRSNAGGNYRVVVQRRSSGHTNILTKQNPKISLARTMGILRLQEAALAGIEIDEDDSLLTIGVHKDVPNWYYDSATNSLLNGGVSPDQIEPTKIDWVTLQAIVLHTIEEAKLEK